ncbi:hypothetical protein WCP94_001749 [Bilophila wadsworthia]|jgi:hypothetical protein
MKTLFDGEWGKDGITAKEMKPKELSGMRKGQKNYFVSTSFR